MGAQHLGGGGTIRVSPRHVAGHGALWLLASVAALLGIGSLVNGWLLAGAVMLTGSVMLIASSFAWKRLPLPTAWPAVGVVLVMAGVVVAALSPTQRAVSSVAPVPTVTVPPARTPTPLPVPTVAPHQIGQPVILTDAKGGKLSVTVNAFEDSVQPARSSTSPQGRYAVVDWTIRNDGATEITVNRLELKVQTADGYIVQRAGSLVREPDLQTSKIGPGQAVRGWLAYDVPNGQRIVTAIYQPEGSRQFVVADLPH